MPCTRSRTDRIAATGYCVAFEHIDRKHAASPMQSRMAKTRHPFIFKPFGLIIETDL